MKDLMKNDVARVVVTGCMFLVSVVLWALLAFVGLVVINLLASEAESAEPMGMATIEVAQQEMKAGQPLAAYVTEVYCFEGPFWDMFLDVSISWSAWGLYDYSTASDHVDIYYTSEYGVRELWASVPVSYGTYILGSSTDADMRAPRRSGWVRYLEVEFAGMILPINYAAVSCDIWTPQSGNWAWVWVGEEQRWSLQRVNVLPDHGGPNGK